MTAPGAALWRPCSDSSRERGDPLSGTAGLGVRWLLVEIDGGWGRHAFFESRIDPEVGRAIVRRAEGAGIRPVAIRRPGRRTEERWRAEVMRWALADARPGQEQVRWGTVADAAELLTLPLDGTAGTPSDEPVVLVCTHGRHDRCCAVRGRPVAQALHRVAPEETWESSHLGGDRFAPTMIILPSTLMYGRVPADRAPSILASAREGLIAPDWFRGRACVPPVVQAAQAAVREDSGDQRIDAYPPLGYAQDGHVWTVRLGAPSGELAVSLREEWSEPLLSTCDATAAAPVRRFTSLSIEPIGSIDPG